MALPRLGQYQAALQHPVIAFADPELRAARVESTPMGLPRVISGGFALTYHLKSGAKDWAVRCFHREAADLQRRYDAIGRVVGHGRTGPFVPVEYLPRGVLVEGQWHPITKMPWLDAVPLNRFIEAGAAPARLAKLPGQFHRLVEGLHAQGIAHGDLQHGNILVDGAGELRLVDYDGMYVPALRGMRANESGHVNYQHPGRTSQFDEGIDRFSSLVIYVALTALAARPALWQRYSNGDNLLFKRADFLDPDGSPLFRELLALPETAAHASRLRAVCRGGYDAVPALNRFLAGGQAARPATSVTAPSGVSPLTARPGTSTVPPAPRAVLRQYEVLSAHDTALLCNREGDVVTVTGRVTGVRRGLTRFGKPYAFVNFGAYQAGCFNLVLWSQALDLYERTGHDLESYRGRWVSVTGLLLMYRPRAGSGRERPQMMVSLPSEIQLIDEAEACTLLGEEAVALASGDGARRARQAAALNRLYGGPPITTLPARSTRHGTGGQRAGTRRAGAANKGSGRRRIPRGDARTGRAGTHTAHEGWVRTAIRRLAALVAS